MALLNHAKKELSAKIVYYGPGLSGKTTNLEWIHRKLAPDKRGKLISLETKTDRTLFFDFLPVQIGEISGFRTRFNVYTVPGQIFYNETRRMVLKGVDGIVFVADSQKEMANENLENLKNLAENLRSIGKELSRIPLVIQFNKRDLPNILTVEEMNRLLNAPGLPFFEAVAVKGEGVLTTLTRITRVVADHLKQTLFAGSGASAPAGRPQPAPPPETRSEPPPAFTDSPSRQPDPSTPAFLSSQPQAAVRAEAPEPQVFSQDKPVSPSFENTIPNEVKAPLPGPAAAPATPPAAQPLQAEDIPSLGDLGDTPDLAPQSEPMPTLASVEPSPPVSIEPSIPVSVEPSIPVSVEPSAAASVEPSPPVEVSAPSEAAVAMEGAAQPTDRVIPIDRGLTRPAPEPTSPEAPAGTSWVDPSMVSVTAEQISPPPTQKGVALRFGEPERESGNEVRIPFALRLEATNEIVSFRMTIRVEQEPEEEA